MVAAPGVAAVPSFVRADDFEGPETFAPQDVIEAKHLKGDYFEVIGDVVAQGYSNRYQLTTRYEERDIITLDELIKSEHEALALAYLETIKNTEAFASGMMRALKSPYKAVKALVTDPVNTLVGVPEGIWKFGRRIGEMFTGSRGDDEDHVAEELFGFSQIKRKIAYKLGVDVYSQNEMLQRAMNDVAYAGFAGGFILNKAMGGIPISSIGNRALSAVEFTRTAAQFMRDNAPEDLRIRNRKSLKNMGISEQDVTAFIDNDVFSPRHETIITLALEEMDSVENRGALIKRTHGVGSTIGALLTQRSIEMMRSYNAIVTPVLRIADVGPHAGLVDKEGVLLLAMPADRIHWTPWFAGAVTALSQQSDGDVRSRRIAISGTASPRAREESRRLNIGLKEDARSSLLPAPEIEWPTPEIDTRGEALPVPGSPIALDGAVTAVGKGDPQPQQAPENNEPRANRAPPPALF